MKEEGKFNMPNGADSPSKLVHCMSLLSSFHSEAVCLSVLANKTYLSLMHSLQ